MAEVFHIRNSDAEKVFCFSFATAAENHGGTPHILEHLVLSGSNKFPSKDPFLSVLKKTVHTFVNALTFPDKTLFPAASVLDEDFKFLFQVFADAVFAPLLRKESFLQEGWRFEEGFSGVVYNEMLGEFFNSESILADQIMQNLYPDTPYKWNSGGDPRWIPQFGYEYLQEFHRNHYHPGNLRLFLYGDIDLDSILPQLAEDYLNPFMNSAARVSNSNPVIPMQSPWERPRTFVSKVPGSIEQLHQLISWKTGSQHNRLELLSYELLSDAILGSSGAPLTKSLREAFPHADLSPFCGFDSDLLEGSFSVGMRSLGSQDFIPMKTCILDSFFRLLENGIDQSDLEVAYTRMEFRYKERKGGLPYGLRLAELALRAWNHGIDPFAALSFPDKQLRELIHQRKGYLESLIDEGILRNTHALSVEQVCHEDYEAEFHESLAKMETWIPKTPKEDIRAFQTYQQEPDPDLPSPQGKLEYEIQRIENYQLSSNQDFLAVTDDPSIIYMQLNFSLDLEGILNPDDLYFLPFFARGLGHVGTKDLDHTELSRNLARFSGGFYPNIDFGLDVDGRLLGNFSLSTKVLSEDLDRIIDLSIDLLNFPAFDRQDRFRQVLNEQKK
jgi:Zn-dependent M16 (insulinase) family peptidase